MKSKTFPMALLIIATAISVSAGQDLNKASSTSKSDKGASNADYYHPVLKNYGKVVQLPDASQQPRTGSKIVADVTKGGPADKLNPAIDNVARFVNIYQGAGKEPAQVEIAIVLHGKATLTVLNDAAYSKRFKTQGNPNLKCLKALRDSGVKVFVCGQSLRASEAKPEDITPLASVAVSALTSLVNLQMDGYAFVLLGN